MKSFTTFLAMAGIATAQQVNYMRVMALRSASPIHYASLEARGFSLWLGGNTSSYCPDVVEKAGGCPAGNTTSVVESNGGLYMGANVPGGQIAYIDSCTGAIGYTQAHSQNIPEDAIQDGWSVQQNALADGLLGILSWRNGLLACPENGEWQVYANIEDHDFPSECLGFDAVFTNSTAPTVWQYE